MRRVAKARICGVAHGGVYFVSNAQDNGCSALLSVTCHGENNVARFLTQNPIAQRNFIDSLLFILDSVNADGIVIILQP